MKQIQIVVLVAIRQADKVLLTKRVEADPEDSEFHNVWQIPGGGLEFGEHPEETATREAREELGIEIEIINGIPSVHTSVRGDWQGILIPYACKMKHDEQQIVLNEEASDFKWVTLQQAEELDLTPFTKMIIKKAFD